MAANTQHQQPDWRDKTYTPDDLQSIYLIAGGIVIGLIGVFIGAVLFAGDNPLVRDVTGYWMNLSTELVSIVVIILSVNWLAERSEIRRHKARLLFEVHSKERERAVSAIDELRYVGWLTGTKGLLLGAVIPGANLTGASLYAAMLQGADLMNANLQKANLALAHLDGANLMGAQLEGATLTDATLCRANLAGAILQGADLQLTDLREADLTSAGLQGVNLAGANLQGACLNYARMQNADLTQCNLQGADLKYAQLTGARMPNGETWYDGMDGGQFTNLDHPNFWRSDEPNSPAYSGKGE